MKKLLNKLRRKKPEENSTRITNDTIAEHRERILAGGRRFKYPLQYAKHRVVINAIVISVAVAVLLVAVFWWQLYIVQNSSDLFYRITRVIPVPVASVDKKSVPYSDYLMTYRSSIHYLVEKEQVNIQTGDGQRQLAHIKQVTMDEAVRDAYARQLAEEKGISVSDEEVQSLIEKQRSAEGSSESTYNAVIQDYYGWSPDEYEYVTKSKLLVQKVAYAVDEQASSTVTALNKQIEAGKKDLEEIAKNLNDNPKTVVEYGTSALVPKDNLDGNIAQTAASLKKGEISSVIQPINGGGYYVVKLVESTDDRIKYDYIYVGINRFEEMIAALKEDNKVKIYIDIPSSDEDA